MYGSEDNQPAPFDLLASAEADDSLNSLLAEEDVIEFGDIAAEPAGFDDLEAMLAEDSASVTAIHDQSDATDAFDDDNDETTADFADLEALLDDRPELAPELTATEIPPTPAIGLEKSVDDEFGDLEALLQDADQTLGVGSSPARKSSAVSNRRPNRRSGLNEQTMRVSVKHLDNLNNLVGEMVVNRNSLEQAEERLRQFLDNLLYQVQQLSDVGQRMRDLYERSLLESSLLSSRRGQSGTTPISGFGLGQTNHATGLSFDALEMDRFTGFHTLSQEMIELIVRVRESASDIDFVVEETDQVTRNFRQITTQLQEGLTRSRMVPFAQTADRLPRGVRDNSLRYGKQAELLIEGRDTLIDKMIVEQLYDPMTHLVNNAIAHGIETPEERIAAGKPPTGRIIIRAFHQGNQTVISVSDDGAGINPEKVRAKALAKGLITPAQAREMSRLDTYDLLFHHGFSTVEQVDDLRGRGVGLDVVRSNLNEIRGTINIDSTVGKGTTFTIRLPLTLSISKALCCISNRARIAFPMDGVEDMLDVPQERIQIDEQGRQCIQWRDGLLPFQPLSELLRYNRVLGRGSVYGGNQEEDIISIVVLRSAGNFLALQVDQVLGEQEIVIKQLEGPIPKPLGVAGATVLGDGRIMPIADVLELIDLWQGRIRREAGSSLWDQGEAQVPAESATKTEPTVLIVDDSITVRELLSMTFSKVGYRVEQARDGQEAWEKLRSGLPCDLVFCDIEMPRMDGLELLSRIQKDANLNHLPIAMLTSRGADRHRQMAVQLGAKGYFTKPYLEEMLLDAAQRMLKGEVLVSSTNIQ
ncbi:MAG: hybrid sensor histidine kinase/response regulator [Leptolyngbya sp. IPPAS B-1204]